MVRITKETQNQLKNLFLRIKPRSVISELLLTNISNNKQYIGFDEIKKTHNAIRYLKNNQLIMITHDRFELTDFGKFVYLMCRFKVNFLELCFLLETYCCEKRIKLSCDDGFYLKYSFYEKMEDVISYGTLSNIITNLSKKGLIYRHHKASYSITPEIYVELTKYQEIIDNFHSWFIDTHVKKNEIILRDPLIIRRQSEYSDFYKRITCR